MRKLGSFIFVILAAVVLVIAVAAQTSLSPWPYYVEVITEKTSPGLYDVAVPLPVLDKASEDLGDLRLYDSANREIPYAIRVLREINETRAIDGRLFNYALVGLYIAEVSVDLGENPGEHNEVEIETTGKNFRRQVSIEGSDTGQEWRTLIGNGTIFSFESQSSAVESNHVSYPTSRYRYLRVRVQRDQLVDGEAPNIKNVKAMMAIREKGQLSTWGVPVPSYQLLRNQGAYASAWTLDLGARAPCDRLMLGIDDESFSRAFEVEAVDDPQNVRLIARGEITRHVGEINPVVITFDQEELVRKLKLQITDYSNPTLSIQSIQASAPARQLVFELKEPPAKPLRLFFGSTTITAPHYDFEKELWARASFEPSHASLSQVIGNPDYKPEPLPLTERVPWLIYFVLAASSLALAAILLSLARAAMRSGPQPTN